jgi:tetratricopeptide (TPR) repeat protein
MPDEMFNEAVRAAKSGQRRRAKDLLTRLLKADQENINYWLWMSAVVDTEKEQIFCLQKALKIDPNSIAARRGLVVLGALKPEDSGLPPAQLLEDVPVEVPELARGSGVSGFLSRRRNREVLAIVGIGSVALVMVVVLLLALVNPNLFRPRRVVVVVHTPTPSNTAPPTATPLPTDTPEPCAPPAEVNPATPLAAYLCLTQTPTPIPIATERTLSEDYRSMIVAYTNGEWNEVLERAERVTRDQTLVENARVYFYIAEAQRHQGLLAEALTNYRTAIAKDATFAPAHWGKARVEFTQKKQREALADLAAAIEADPSFVLSYLDRAAYSRTVVGDYTSAIADLEQARTAAPTNAYVLAHLALSYAESNVPDRAVEAAARALELDPGQELAYYARGLAHQIQGQLELADRDLTLSSGYLVERNRFAELFPVLDALELYPVFSANVRYRYALVKAARGDDLAALSQLDQALSLYAEFPAAYLVRGQIHLRAANYESASADFARAISQFQQSAASDPRLIEAYLGNGQALLALNQPDRALPNFQSTVQLDPNNFEGLLGVGQSLVLDEKAEAALPSFANALNAAKDDGQRARVYYWRAQAFKALDSTMEEVADLALLAALTAAPGNLASTAQARLTEIGPLPTETRTSAPPTPTRTALPGTPTVRVTLTPRRTATLQTPTATRTP